MKSDLRHKDFDEAVGIALFMLEEIGIRFRTLHDNPRTGDMKSILGNCTGKRS